MSGLRPVAEKNKPNSTKVYLTAFGVALMCLSIVALAGFFGIGGTLGQKLATIFQTILGSTAWIGPFITIGAGAFCMFAKPSGGEVKGTKARPTKANNPSITNVDRDIVSKGRGFKEYFSDEDPLDEHKEKGEPFQELEEVGDNFATYFGSQTAPKVRLTSVGTTFTDYFADDEVACAAQPAEAEEPSEPEAPTKNSLHTKISFQNFVSRLKQEEKTAPKLFALPTEPPAEENATVVPDDKQELTFVAPFHQPATDEQLTFSVQPEASQVQPQQDSEYLIKPTPAVAAEINLPPLTLLDPPSPGLPNTDSEAQHNAEILQEALQNFGVKVKVTDISQGPAITRYEIQPAPGIKISRIVNLADDMALALAAPDIRIEAPIPGKSAVGIEVPNKKVSTVKFREVLESGEFGTNAKLKVALGKDIAGKPVVADLRRMPHLLVAGATGSGKSVCMNTIITSILYTAKPDEVKFLLVDPKMVELTKYNGIPHLIAPVVTDPKKAAAALRWVVNEMETRYELFAATGVRDISRYNDVNPDKKPLPYVVVLIDELADLMMIAPREVEDAICRLAQMARAAGIHLVVATQRPSVDVITGIIKANIPSRIAFAVSSQIDSRTIIDGNGAEKLLGKGDMLYYPLGMAKPLRVQGCYLSDQEVERVVKHWKSQAKPEYMNTFFEPSLTVEEDKADDELFEEAAKLFITTGMASVSLLQRRLRVGYTRAARLMDLLEQQGVVGGFEGSKPRQVLLSLADFEERFKNNDKIMHNNH